MVDKFRTGVKALALTVLTFVFIFLAIFVLALLFMLLMWLATDGLWLFFLTIITVVVGLVFALCWIVIDDAKHAEKPLWQHIRDELKEF